MTWQDIVLPVATGLLGLLGGTVLASKIRGKPPAPRDAWEAERKGSDQSQGRK